MSEEKPLGQRIFYYKARIGWRKKKGNGYTNHYKDIDFVSRAANLEILNNDPEFLMQVMAQNGLTGSRITNFGVTKIYEIKELSRSFFYKEE